MSPNDEHRQNIRRLIVLVGVKAVLWAAAMLVGGFRAAGQLDSPYNPLGEYVIFLAAASMVAASALFFYALGSRQRAPLPLLLAAGLITLKLTLFASVTQLVMVVDSSTGEQFLKGLEVQVNQGWNRAAQTDRRITAAYERQVDYQKQRMEEERETGKGPRYRQAERRYNELRGAFGGVLGRTAKMTRQGHSLSGDAAGLQAYAGYLRSKVDAYQRFAEAEGLVPENFAAQLVEIEKAAASVGPDGWIDRKSVVYAKVMEKLGTMIESRGRADLGFTMQAMLAVTPDLIQVLCAILLIFLRPREQAGSYRGEASDWSPEDQVWGENVSGSLR